MVIPQENRGEPWSIYVWIDVLRNTSTHIQRQRQHLMDLRGDIARRLKENRAAQQWLMDHAQTCQVLASDKSLRALEDMCLSITHVLSEMDRALIGVEVSLPAHPDTVDGEEPPL